MSKEESLNVKDNTIYKIFELYKKSFTGQKVNLNKFTNSFLESIINEFKLDITSKNPFYNNLKMKEYTYFLKYYSFSSKLDWGKYENDTVKEVLGKDFNYIKWCIVNLDSFYLQKTFFLTKEALLLDKEEYLKMLEINMIKELLHNEMIEIKYQKEISERNNSWEDSMLNDGFEGDIDVWNHYNQ